MSAMSNESHALSRVPPSPPAEDDGNYEAIHAAVMETARGRWFLQEYAQRNRHADTRLVLAAIQRLESVIGASSLPGPSGSQGFRGELLDMARAIARTRSEVPDSRHSSPDPAPQDRATEPASAAPAAASLPPDVFAAAKRIQEVAWTMRERGVELSTCDQIARLASSILGGSSLRNASDSRAQKLNEVLQHLERRIHSMLDSCGDGAEALQPDAGAIVDVAETAPEPSVAELAEVTAAEEAMVVAPAATELSPEPPSTVQAAEEPEPELASAPAVEAESTAAEQMESLAPADGPMDAADTVEMQLATDMPAESVADLQPQAAAESDCALPAPPEAPAAEPLSSPTAEPGPPPVQHSSAELEPVIFEFEPLVVIPAGAQASFAAGRVELELPPVAVTAMPAGNDAGPEPLVRMQMEWASPAPAMPSASPLAHMGSAVRAQAEHEPPAPDVQETASEPAGESESAMLAMARAALPEPQPVSPDSAVNVPPAREDRADGSFDARKAPSDRLAAIRAMSDSERIALFS